LSDPYARTGTAGEYGRDAASGVMGAEGRRLEPMTEPRQVLESTFTVRVYREDGSTGTGSGFLVDPHHVVTNFHVIEDAVDATLEANSDRTILTVHGVAAYSREADLAVLRVSPVDRSPLPIAQGETVDVGAEILVFGSPQGYTGTVSAGIVSAFRTIDGRPLMQMTAPVSPGSSGGPVVSGGYVVGVTVSSVVEAQNINFAVRVSELRRLLESVGESYVALQTVDKTARTAATSSEATPSWRRPERSRYRARLGYSTYRASGDGSGEWIRSRRSNLLIYRHEDRVHYAWDANDDGFLGAAEGHLVYAEFFKNRIEFTVNGILHRFVYEPRNDRYLLWQNFRDSPISLATVFEHVD
jgi:S1-C subfamily serine protease